MCTALRVRCRYYTADITRCFPACASTGWGAAERDVYQAVLDSQMVALEAITPGAAWSDVDRTVRMLCTLRCAAGARCAVKCGAVHPASLHAHACMHMHACTWPAG